MFPKYLGVRPHRFKLLAKRVHVDRLIIKIYEVFVVSGKRSFGPVAGICHRSGVFAACSCCMRLLGCLYSCVSKKNDSELSFVVWNNESGGSVPKVIADQRALSNEYLKQEGLFNLEEYWKSLAR